MGEKNKKFVYFRIFWIIIAIYCITMAIFCMISNNTQDGIYFILLAIYVGGVNIAVKYFRIDRRYKILEKFYKKTNWERRIIFYDDYFETINADINQLRLQYSDIVDIEKNDKCLKVKINNGYIRVYKDAFIKSNFEECEEFLKNKKNNSKLEA